MSVGFVKTKNGGHWEIHARDPESWGGFMSDELQYYLFPFFEVGSTKIDPYDGAEFAGELLHALAQKLRDALPVIASMPPDWPLAEVGTERYYRVGEIYRMNLKPPRQQAIEVIERAIFLADMAYRENEQLIFIGD